MYNAPLWYQEIRGILLLAESLTGTMLFWQRLPKRQNGRLGCVLFWCGGSVLIWLLQRAGWQDYPVAAYLLSIAMVYACCRTGFWSAVMVGSTGYLVQQLFGNASLAMRTLTPIGQLVDGQNVLIFYNLVIYGGGYLMIWRINRKVCFSDDLGITTLNKVSMSAMELLFCFGFYFINAYVRGWERMTTTELGVNALYVFMGSCFVLMLQYDVIRSTAAQKNLNVMQTLLQTQTAQFEASAVNAELVSEKYHDLKKALHGLQGTVSEKSIEKISETLDAYDDRVETGSRVTDILLTEERGLCRKYGIEFTCFLDGTDLSFMEDMELYFLLKNMLDNAVEAVRKLPEEEARFISLTCRREDGAVALHCENPCGAVAFEDGYPQTEQDRDYHGFGVRSMERTAEKYNGTLSARVLDGVFLLDILMFP